MFRIIIFLHLICALVFADKSRIWTEGKPAFSSVPTVNLPDFSALVEALEDSVVNIYTTQIRTQGEFGDPQFRDLFEFFFDRHLPTQPQRKAQSLGTGFLISKDGYILTNYHVVKNSDVILVKFAKTDTLGSSGKPAKLVGRDPEMDLALLKIDVKNDLKFVALGDSAKVRTGEWVIAMGNPFGLGQTVTKGIITAQHRELGLSNFENYIQTDASINPGNSGGPLFNLNGEVIGINTAILAGGAQGVGFAIPINMVKEVLPQLVTNGQVSRGFIGVASQPLTEELKKELKFPIDREGVLLASVEAGLPADNAGLKPGDIVVMFNGMQTDTPSNLLKAVGRTAVGKTVTMDIFRQGTFKTLNITLIERTQQEKLLGQEKLFGKREKVEEEKIETYLGMRIVKNNSALKVKYNLSTAVGVLVIKVEPDSAAYDAGIESGDIIDSLNGERVDSLNDIKIQIKRSKNSCILRVRRGMGYFFTSVRKN